MREKEFIDKVGDVLMISIVVFIISMMILITTSFVIGLLTIVDVI